MDGFLTAILSLSIFGFKNQVIKHPALENIKGVLEIVSKLFFGMSNILITGHSFIDQYQDYLNHLQLPQYCDLSNCLGLPEHIFVEGIGGLKADKKGFTYITNRIHNIKPHIVLLELGTNDIADSAARHFKSPEEQVGHLIVQIHSICGELFGQGVKRVVVCKVIERHKFCGTTILHEFNTKRDLYKITFETKFKQYCLAAPKENHLGIERRDSKYRQYSHHNRHWVSSV